MHIAFLEGVAAAAGMYCLMCYWCFSTACRGGSRGAHAGQVRLQTHTAASRLLINVQLAGQGLSVQVPCLAVVERMLGR
jgi:hypothetical protein